MSITPQRIYDLDIYAPENVVAEKARREIETGTYEIDEIKATQEVLRPDLPVIELGAGIGVVSCYINRLLDDKKQHLAVEMHPDALEILKHNRKLNDCEFQPYFGTLMYEGDTHLPELDASQVEKMSSEWDPCHHAGLEGSSKQFTLRQLVEETGWEQFNLVADMEGMEMAMLKHDFSVIRERAATVSLEIHPHAFGPRGAAWVIRTLEEAGLRLEAFSGCFAFRRPDA
ncbi:FkbM family methyltransferase [Streptomyces sp. NPDC058092]|uniref:FkbM family methyltransferase n=1 Tax=Streptomyces sp. NPDC058092 TaxID=3346336 RepID=UPI0036E10D18